MELKNTGERMIPAMHQGTLIYGEHIARYEYVAKALAGKTVLDIASGAGYGSRLLAHHAKTVVGVDISEEAVFYARERYAAPNLEFHLGDATKIPLPNAAVDAVVSFETIEHIHDYRGFLKEVKRVLRPGGQLIVSTPNDDVFGLGNEFHVHEFQHEEFRILMDEFFAHKRWAYQDTWLYTAILNEQHFTSSKTLAIPTIKTVASPASRALYYIVIGSDAPIDTEIEELAVVAEPWSFRVLQTHEQAQTARIQELEAAYRDLERVKHEQETLISNMRQQIAQRDQRLTRTEGELAEFVSRPGFRALEVLRQAKETIAPSGSTRDRFVKSLFTRSLDRVLSQ